jgi:molybdenum cofactor cytidylyltransferase
VIRGLLLCGGRSSRFGSDKLLFRHSREGGSPLPLVASSARHLVEGAGNALAVIPLAAAELRRVLEDAGCDILESRDTARGLGASLAAGIAAASDADGWIVALGDMPFIRAATIGAVRAKLAEGALIAAPVLAATGERGHPVGFASRLKDELLALDGDQGARAVIERHRDMLATVRVDDPGIVIDIDTPGDLERT